MEKPETETKEIKPNHQMELEQELKPREGEACPDWLKRIGGENVELIESLKEHKAGEDKAKEPLLIDEEGNFILTKESVNVYLDKDKIEKMLASKNPNIRLDSKAGKYFVDKKLFVAPEVYLYVIGNELKKNLKIVADKKFGEGVDKWVKELKGEETKEKPEEKKSAATPEKKPKKKSQPKAGPPRAEKTPTLTLEEQIALKEKELEKAEQEAALYQPVGWFRKKPVVKSLNYYANEKRIEDLKKEIKELKAEGKPAATRQKLEHLGGKQAGPPTSQRGEPKSEGFGREPKKLSKAKEYLSKKAKKVFRGIGGSIQEELKESRLEREALKKSGAKERKLEFVKAEKRLAEIEKILKKGIPQGIKRNRVLSQPFFELAREKMKLEKRLKKLGKKRKIR